ncbi:tetratricopeptide repeat protein [Spirochaeta cellobiosiphila]|uniref:tetratricopeptide repeat protein n=1 Tax=Spirochaeta cellobiosiphila TaxID=504483 RepID=UPI0003FAFFBA|nr:hypothetical protein [Spirochaeta cellobiosiphila]
MIKKRRLLSVLLLGFICVFSYAELTETTSEHFVIYSDKTLPEVQILEESLEDFYQLVDEYLTFPTESNLLPYRVYDFSTKEEFQQHLLESSLPTNYQPPIYLHFETPKYRRLLGVDLVENWTQTKQQLTIQLIRGAFGTPPYWLQEGYSLFFSDTNWNNKISQPQASAWLLEAKKIIKQDNPFQYITNEDGSKGVSREARIASWAWVNFLVHSPSNFDNRRIWNAWHLVNKSYDRNKNTEAVAQQLFLHSRNEQEWNIAIKEFYKGQLSFSESLGQLIDYIKNDKSKVVDKITLMENTYPDMDYRFDYYCGLYYYQNSEWEKSIKYYRQSIKKESPAGLSEYGLILALYKNNQIPEAKSLWESALIFSEETYKASLNNLNKLFE